jgi:GNAT superfamily N-acetyltransferase
VITEIPHEDPTCRVFARLDDGKALGVLAIDVASEQVVFVGVRRGCRRHGVATALLEAAREHTGLALDMDYGERAPDGDAFARAVGLKRGPVRERIDQGEMEAKTSEWLCAVETVVR